MAKPRCGICNHTEDEHADMKHEFSETGELMHKKEEPALPKQQEMTIEGVVPSLSPVKAGKDLVLRALLMEKGIISLGELDEMQARIERDGVVFITGGVAEPNSELGGDRPDN